MQSTFRLEAALALFPDGNAILAMDRWAVFNRQGLIGERLTAILIELRYNRKLFKTIEERFTRYIDGNETSFPAGFRLRLNACSAYLRAILAIV